MVTRRTALSLASTIISQLCVVPLVAAQTPAPAAQSDQPADQPAAEAAPPKKAAEEEIVVTGTRVRRKDLTTPAPVTVISKEQLQNSGKVSIGDFLQSLPEQGNAVNTSVNNGNAGDGSTRVSLRGLGPERTLVLLNGRRYVAGGAGANASVDLSSIPSAAIERIEVLKDGASAVYGSDAIAGVINLITRKRMNGVEVTGFTGTSTHADGTTFDLNATAGTSGERGSLLFSTGYYNQNSVWAGDRNFAAIPRVYSLTAGQITNGSPFGPNGTFALGSCRFVPPNTPCIGRQITGSDPSGKIAFYNSLISRNPDKDFFIRTTASDPRGAVCDGSGNCWRPVVSTVLPNYGGDLTAGGDGYNFQPENYLVTPQRRISLFSVGDARLGSLARAYFEGSYVNRQGAQKLAPEPLLSGLEKVTVSKDNIYNPFGVDLDNVHRRLLEFGHRDFKQDLDTFRVVAGLDGSFPDEAGPLKKWSWDLNFNFGRSIGANTKRGNLFKPRIQDAVGPSMVINGQPRCVQKANDPTTAIAGCVPLDLFHGAIDPLTGASSPSISADQVTALTYTGNSRALNQLVSGQANLSGELFKLLSERPVGLALGYEYRIVAGENIPDPITVYGLTTGNKSEITSGHYYVNEGYGELSIPILGGLPFAQNLEGTAALRVFNYSNFRGDYTYKFGGRWTVVPDFTLRGTYSTGYRAPSVQDLFLGQSDSFPRLLDPCRGNGVAGWEGDVPPNCIAQGLPENGTRDAQPQLRSRIGGNPALKPETAKTYTAGVVIEPRWIRGFTATVDYYHATIEQSISTIGAQLIVNQCYPTGESAAPRYCDFVQRDPANGRISNVIDINQNVGKDETDGIDLALNYLLPTPAGRFNFIFDGTWLHKFDRTLADGSVLHAKDTYDLSIALPTGGVYPAFKFLTGVRWAMAGLSAGVTTRFLSSFHECGTREGLFNGSTTCYARLQPGDVGVTAADSRTVSAYNSWDMFASYQFPSSFGMTTIGLGINNVFNTNPPSIYNGFLAASDPTAYDYLGRFMYGRVAHAF